MLTDTAVLILVREGFNVAEVAEAFGLADPVAERYFMRAVGEIDREGRIEASRQRDRDRYPRRGRGRFSAGARSS